MCWQAVEVVRRFKAALKEGGGEYLFGKLSYADVLLAITLQGVCPPGQPRPLPAARATAPIPSQELYDEVKDLQPWVDNILDKHLPY